MQDKILTIFGTVFGGRALAYSRIDQSRLPDHVKNLLGSYKGILLVLCGAVLVPLLSMKAISVVFFVPLAGISYFLKLKFEKQLDPLLEPYIPKEEAN